MNFGDKLAKLRKEQNYTQEQLAALLGVSRQSVSKWESNTAYPETEKLIRLSDLFGYSLDYLLKDVPDKAPDAEPAPVLSPYLHNMLCGFERKSSKQIRGIPLYHINVGLGRTAHGIFAVGLVSRGVFSVGLLSAGVFSLGIVSVGLLAIGTLAAGLIACGSIAVGALAFGSIAAGLFACGACAVGAFSVGSAANGFFAAKGDYATGRVAIGKTEVYGEIFQKLGRLSGAEKETARTLLMETTPFWLRWAAQLFLLFL